MNVKTPIEGANSLTKNALDHCIFPITHRDDVEKYGPMIMASGSGVQVVDIHGRVYLDMMGSHTRANSLGYGNAEIARAVQEQLTTLHYIGRDGIWRPRPSPWRRRLPGWPPADWTRSCSSAAAPRPSRPR